MVAALLTLFDKVSAGFDWVVHDVDSPHSDTAEHGSHGAVRADGRGAGHSGDRGTGGGIGRCNGRRGGCDDCCGRRDNGRGGGVHGRRRCDDSCGRREGGSGSGCSSGVAAWRSRRGGGRSLDLAWMLVSTLKRWISDWESRTVADLSYGAIAGCAGGSGVAEKVCRVVVGEDGACNSSEGEECGAHVGGCV